MPVGPSMRWYAPAPTPATPEALPRFVATELNAVAAAIRRIGAGSVEVSYTPPEKPRDGDIRLADGTHWNPGAGAGVYAYYGGGWNKLG